MATKKTTNESVNERVNERMNEREYEFESLAEFFEVVASREDIKDAIAKSLLTLTGGGVLSMVADASDLAIVTQPLYLLDQILDGVEG